MIETIILRPHARARHLQAPLLKERNEYLSHLFRQGHELRYLRLKASLLLHAIRLISISVPRQLSHAELKRAAASWADDTEFHKSRQAGDRTAYRLYILALDFFRYHRLTIEPDAPHQSFAPLLIEFKGYLQETRGLASGTIRSYTERAAKFLNWVSIRLTVLQMSA